MTSGEAIVAASAVVQGAMSIGLLLWRGGRWSRSVEGDRPIKGRPPSVTGGHDVAPSMIDLARRVERLERDSVSYQRADLAKVETRNVWQAINDLRHADSAITRRIDSLMGQGS